MAKERLQIIVDDGGSLKKVGANAVKAGRGLDSIAKSALKVGAAYFSGRGLIRGISSAIEAFGIQEAAEKKLEVALGRTSRKLLDQAAALQQVSTFGDETIIGVQAMIGAFIDQEDQIALATAATLDLAAGLGIDLKNAGDLVAKTLGSSTNALTRYGIQVEGAVGSTERLESFTTNLAKVFGGQAVAATDTMTGSIQQASNAAGDAAEAFGELLSPMIIVMAKEAKDAAEDMQELIVSLDAEDLKASAAAVGILATAMGTYAVATTSAAVATGILNAALKLGAITAVLALGVALKSVIDASDIFKDKEEEIADAAGAAGDGLVEFTNDVALLSVNLDEQALVLQQYMDLIRLGTPGIRLWGEETAFVAEQIEIFNVVIESLLKTGVEGFVQTISGAQDSLNTFAQFTGAALQLSDQLTQGEINNINKVRDRRIKAVLESGRTEEQKAAAIENIRTKAEAQASAARKKQKPFLIAEGLANTSLAVIKALDDAPFPFNLGIAALIAAAGAMEVANISSQQFARGTSSAPGGRARVGEEGPEDVILPAGARVLSNQQSNQRGTGPPQVIQLVVDSQILAEVFVRGSELDQNQLAVK